MMLSNLALPNWDDHVCKRLDMIYAILKHFFGWLVCAPFITTLLWLLLWVIDVRVRELKFGISGFDIELISTFFYFSTYGIFFCLIVTVPAAFVSLWVVSYCKEPLKADLWRCVFVCSTALLFLLFSLFTSCLIGSSRESLYLVVSSLFVSVLLAKWTLSNLTLKKTVSLVIRLEQ